MPPTDAHFLSVDMSLPAPEHATALADAVSPGDVVFAHSAGAVPVALALQGGLIAPSALILVEPALYDIARGDSTIERHIALVTRARALAADGDLFGYWSIIRPLMFGGPAEESRWAHEQDAARAFSIRRPPWGHHISASTVAAVPTLVVTGGWNDEYERIAHVLTRHGGVHRTLVGNEHRCQDHPAFTETVDGFLRSR